MPAFLFFLPSSFINLMAREGGKWNRGLEQVMVTTLGFDWLLPLTASLNHNHLEGSHPAARFTPVFCLAEFTYTQNGPTVPADVGMCPHLNDQSERSRLVLTP